MEFFMWVFGIVLFIFSCFGLVVAIIRATDDKDKFLGELLQREEYSERLQTNLTLYILYRNFLPLGEMLVYLLGIFFGSVIIYLYK